MSMSKYRSALLAGVAAFAIAAPASALTINLIDIGGVTGSQAEVGFKVAAAYWGKVLSNTATVNLNVGYSDLGPGVLGATGSNLATFVPIADYYDALAATQTSAIDAMAVANLQALNGTGNLTNLVVPGYTSPGLGIDVSGSRIAPTGPDDAISNSMALTTANLRAFGVDLGGTIDGEVQFSNTFAFDFNPDDGIAAGTYDFIGVAIHEIGHALGFISGVDDFDYFDGYDGPVDDAWWAYGLDMFRYSAPGQLDLTPGTASYFSLDGGLTAFMDGYFSTGAFNGDGNQASHWKQPNQATPCINFRGIMNPYICSGRGDSVTGLDLALFDAIGWNLNVDPTNYAKSTKAIYHDILGIPEPATWMTLLLGFGVLGAAMRRRRALATA
ncbi:MAG TPA: NF038122 family metalloprotease [Phenylobacterium sp.]